MSGHSHSKTVRSTKEAAAAQRGKAFSKMARLITIAAKEGGNPDENSKLRIAIGKAREVNMPTVNVERAIKRGTGEVAGSELQEVLFEAYGPANIAIIVEGITDNKNRTVAEIKHILGQYNGKLANEGSVKWLFERKGIFTINNQAQEINNKEELELAVIDAGADDFQWDNEHLLEVHTEVNNLEQVKNKLEEKEIKIESSTLGWVAKQEISVSDKDRQSNTKLFEALDENDSVQEIYSNLKV